MDPRRSRRRSWPGVLVVVVAVFVAVVLVEHGHRGAGRLAAGATAAARPSRVAAGGGSHPAPASSSPPSTPVAPSSTPARSSTTSATTVPTTTSTTTLPTPEVPLPPAGNGSLPQTTAVPSVSTAVFRGEMTLLFDAIRSDQPAEAMPAFFPEAAYLQVKALPDDAADWIDRLRAHFFLDVDAAHGALGPDPQSAKLVGVVTDTAYVAWIPPGACYNTLGYYHLPGARLVYDENGQERSIGVASLISWRGYWYVVHLGAVIPPAGVGVVDDPTYGPGVPGPPGGC